MLQNLSYYRDSLCDNHHLLVTFIVIGLIAFLVLFEYSIEVLSRRKK